MILSDEHRFAFVHIPKCAGVSVKQPLRAIDSTNGAFAAIGEHPAMGRIHYAHIPLADLAEHFPAEAAKVRTYRAFAVARDPGDRFLSAMFQRLREFKGLNQSQIDRTRIDEEARGVIAYLERGPARLDLEHVHFNRQVDYVRHDGETWVGDVFPIERMDRVVAHVAQATGIAVSEERENRSIELRLGRAQPLVKLLRRPYFALVPYRVRAALHDRMARAGLYRPVEKPSLIEPGGFVDGFVRRYYAEDYALHAAALA